MSVEWSPQPRGSRMEPWDFPSLTAQYPHITWSEPIKIGAPHIDGDRFACRVCIANHGLKGENIGSLPRTREAFEDHFQEAHGGR